jgi:hypothetical protein
MVDPLYTQRTTSVPTVFLNDGLMSLSRSGETSTPIAFSFLISHGRCLPILVFENRVIQCDRAAFRQTENPQRRFAIRKRLLDFTAGGRSHTQFQGRPA